MPSKPTKAQRYWAHNQRHSTGHTGRTATSHMHIDNGHTDPHAHKQNSAYVGTLQSTRNKRQHQQESPIWVCPPGSHRRPRVAGAPFQPPSGLGASSESPPWILPLPQVLWASLKYMIHSKLLVYFIFLTRYKILEGRDCVLCVPESSSLLAGRTGLMCNALNKRTNE